MDTMAPARRQMTAKERYESLKTERDPYLERARFASKLTIPSLIPEEGKTGNDDLYQPFQSIGARGVSHLAAKLLLALFPPGQPFFKLTMEEYVEDALAKKTGAAFADAKAEFDEAFGRIERTVMTRLEHTGARPTLSELLKHLIVAGNGLLHVQKDGSFRLHPLSRFVVKRDKSGNVIEIVVLEHVARVALSDEAKKIVEETDGPDEDEDHENNVEIYTRVYRVKNSWVVFQETQGKQIPGTEGKYPLKKTPWLPLRFIKIDGEDYGRSFVEHYIGDLRSCEALNKAQVMFAAAASKILIFVNDNGVVTMRMVEEAESTDILPGKADDVTVFQLEKYPDFKVADELLQRVEGRLTEAFLLFSGFRRDAERVTAEEIRAVINELEQGLGGVYSVLAQELQVPLVRRLMHQLQQSEDIPDLPEDSVKPEIVTGVEALGRASEAQKIERFMAGLVEMFGPDVVAQRTDFTRFARRRATALGIDLAEIFKTDEEIKQEQEAAQAAAVAEKAAPQALKQAQEGGA